MSCFSYIKLKQIKIKRLANLIINLNKVSLIIVAISSYLASYGQINTSLDTSLLVSFVDKIVIKANWDKKAESYNLYSKTDGTFTQLVPNEKQKFSLSLDYEFIGLSFYFSPKLLGAYNRDSIRGETKSLGIKYFIFLGKWVQKVEYAKTKGFYILNTEDFIQNWRERKDSYLQFPNLKSIQWSGSTAYVFNPNFSLKNLVYQTEWQKKSSGSFVPKLEYSYQKFKNKDDRVKLFKSHLDTDFGLSYYHTFVLKENWFFACSLEPLLGLRWMQAADTKEIDKLRYSFKKSLNGGLQLGYSSNKVVMGANMIFSLNSSTGPSELQMQYKSVYTKLYIGYRFNSPQKAQLNLKR